MTKPKKIKIHQLTDLGWNKLEDVCANNDKEMCFDPVKDEGILSDPKYSILFEGTKEELTIKKYPNQKEMAEQINRALGVKEFESVQNNLHLWGWFTLALWDNLQADLKGKIKVTNKPYKIDKKKDELVLRESILFIPKLSDDFQKYQRHLVRTPCHLLSKFGTDAEHLLLNKPNTRGDLLEQLTSRHPFWQKTFLKVGKILYFDDNEKKLKKGAGGKGDGTPRELARIFRLFDVTWEIENTTPSQFINRLPKQFETFIKHK